MDYQSRGRKYAQSREVSSQETPSFGRKAKNEEKVEIHEEKRGAEKSERKEKEEIIKGGGSIGRKR